MASNISNCSQSLEHVLVTFHSISIHFMKLVHGWHTFFGIDPQPPGFRAAATSSLFRKVSITNNKGIKSLSLKHRHPFGSLVIRGSITRNTCNDPTILIPYVWNYTSVYTCVLSVKKYSHRYVGTS